MDKEITEILYFHSDVCSRKISTQELEVLYDMFDHPGWGIFLDLKRIDAKEAAIEGLMEENPPEVRCVARTMWSTLCKLLSFREDLRESVKGVDPLPADELNLAAVEVNDHGTIPEKNIDREK